MGLRDLLKKKQALDENGPADPATVSRLSAPEFTFIRSDTYSEEVIHPPSHTPPGNVDNDDASSYLTAGSTGKTSRLSLDVFRGNRSRSESVSSARSGREKESATRRLSHRLHLSRAPSSSENVPVNLPEIITPDGPDPDKEGTESQWEERATMLARENEKHRSRQSSPIRSPAPDVGVVGRDFASMKLGEGEAPARTASPANGVVSSKAIDENIQEAIRLHEEGDLEHSTAMFGRLADPKGANNPLSQVLYGLALRHGWGCNPNPEAAVKYLSAAAANAADIENLALKAGLKKGGAAKGELVLAIFELANCFRQGWGVPPDPIAAKQYYETAANLGDTDAMNEVAWCYLEGFGCKKDKFAAARYYRLAEENGNKTIGNSWIWKDKYSPGHQKK